MLPSLKEHYYVTGASENLGMSLPSSPMMAEDNEPNEKPMNESDNLGHVLTDEIINESLRRDVFMDRFFLGPPYPKRILPAE